MFDMKRREFITLLGGAVVAWPGAARAQQPAAVQRIGVLMAYPEGDLRSAGPDVAFRDGLQKLGWMEGRNIRIDTRWVTTTDAELMQHSRRNSSRYSPTSFCTSTRPRRPRCCNKRAPSLSFSRQSAIRSAAAS